MRKLSSIENFIAFRRFHSKQVLKTPDVSDLTGIQSIVSFKRKKNQNSIKLNTRAPDMQIKAN